LTNGMLSARRPGRCGDGRIQGRRPLELYSAHEEFKFDVQRFADSQKSGHRDWSSGFDLLPVPGGKPKLNHVFLRQLALASCLTNALTQFAEEKLLIDHA